MAEGVPNPAEAEAAAQEAEKQVEIPPVEPPVEPVAPLPAQEAPKPIPKWQFWRKPEQARRASEQEHKKLTSNWAERLEALKDDPEGLMHFLSNMNAQEFQQLRLQEKHGSRLSKFQQILKGDLDFELDEKGLVRRNLWNELGHHAANVIDRQTIVGAGLYGVIGIFAGGFGIPGLAALAGRVAGRAGVEIASAKEMRGAKEKIAHEMLDDWGWLTQKANEYITDKEQMDPTDRANKLTEIIETFYNKSTHMAQAEANLAENQAVWDKRRETWGKIGAVAGGVGGLVTGFTGLTNLIKFGHFHNVGLPATHHAIRVVDGAFQYGETAAEQTVTHFNTMTQVGKEAYHVMGGQFDTAKIFGNVAAGLAAVFGGFKLGKIMENAAKADEARAAAQSAQRLSTQHDEMAAGAAQIGETKIGPAAESAAAPEAAPAIPEQYTQLIQEKGMPTVGEIWLIKTIDPDTKKPAIVSFKIAGIDWGEGNIRVVQVNNQNHQETLGNESAESIERFLSQANKESKAIEYWLDFAKSKDLIRLENGDLVRDQLDIKGQRKLESGKDYRLDLLPDNSRQVQLVDSEGKKSVVNILDLLLGGAVLKEPPKTKEGETADLEVNHRYGLPEGKSLPNELKDFPQTAILRKGKGGFYLDVPNRRPLVLKKEILKTFADLYIDMGPSSGGQQQGGGRRGGGGQGGRPQDQT